MKAWVTVHEAAAILGVSYDNLSRVIRRGRLPVSVTPQGTYLIARADVQARQRAKHRHYRHTHCPKGHPIRGANRYTTVSTGYARCHFCAKRSAVRRYYHTHGREVPDRIQQQWALEEARLQEFASP